ncbi:TetR/AcrR family transcriptional regulator [Riemerella columbipharyngis]|uniref:TetR/AcrR family transcriptional regulator n=1 Tax=Riemerella columbipharyngis TaxID=1071918 RepID=UPI001FDF8842|nr:TetR/AcrR family transcriptional regulator [Riemerella columbipharyngis]
MSELFMFNGAKTLTMDDIAKAFSMSKKTLYQYYKNKEELLVEVLDFGLNQTIEQIQMFEKKKDLNAIQKIFFSKSDIKELCEEAGSIFMLQLIKYYPKIYNAHKLKVYKEILRIMRKNIESGRRERLYKEDFSIENYTKFLLELMFAYDSSVLFEESNAKNWTKHSRKVMLFFLNAIVTPKGYEILKEIIYNEK